MNVSPASGSRWFTALNSSAPKPGSQAGGLGERLYGSGPESMKNLTTQDRDVIRSTTGIDIRDNGEILSPADMSLMDYGTAIYGIQELASSRAHGQADSLEATDFLHGLAVQGYVNSAKLNLKDYKGLDFWA